MRLLEYSDHGYDSANRQTTITDQTFTPSGSGGGTTTPIATFVYSYDQANRVTSETDAEGTASFTYDHANELTGVSGSRTESYSYDLNGNRNSTGYTTTTGNELTAAPGYTFTYDNAGNQTAETNTSTHVVTTYTYDYRNRLTGVEVGGTVKATYTYDALNNRIGIDDNGTQTWTVYDGTNPYADFNGSGTLLEQYVSGPGVVNGAAVDELLARTSSGGTTAWYLTDKLGSVRDIVDSSGSELDHVVYDSFGNVVTETNAANGDRFKFAGMEYDATTGQYYDRARYYDSAIGRFMSRDPLGFAAGDANLSRYAGNSVADETDPSGLVVIPPGGGAAILFYAHAEAIQEHLQEKHVRNLIEYAWFNEIIYKKHIEAYNLYHALVIMGYIQYEINENIYYQEILQEDTQYMSDAWGAVVDYYKEEKQETDALQATMNAGYAAAAAEVKKAQAQAVAENAKTQELYKKLGEINAKVQEDMNKRMADFKKAAQQEDKSIMNRFDQLDYQQKQNSQQGKKPPG